MKIPNLKYLTFFVISFFLASCSKQKLIVTRGLPGAGKSTFAKEYTRHHPNTAHIEKDKLRKELYKDKWKSIVLDRDAEAIVVGRQFSDILIAIKEGKNIIVANTHLDDRHLIPFKTLSEIFNLELIIEDFRDVPLKVCIERDRKREDQAMVDITKSYKKFIEPLNL